MTETIILDEALCNGCNRCVRECSTELANITYRDAYGNVKVRIDPSKCISCGRCISVCARNARRINDGVDQFINALSRGDTINLMVDPAIAVIFPEYKQLFTYLKMLGVKLILDVSYGVSINVWAHIRHIQLNRHTPIIVQPCPVVVSYSAIYQPELLNFISPIHSPMACITIYMKNYAGLTGDFATLSPCVAKSDEIKETGLARYNVTITELSSYVRRHRIKLPQQETDFDLYSFFNITGKLAAGGLRRSIAKYFGDVRHVTGASGNALFDMLDEYAKTDIELLPEILYATNCTTCYKSISAGLHLGNTLDTEDPIEVDIDELDSLCSIYDSQLNLSDYAREYRQIGTPVLSLNDVDLQDGFNQLGKDTDDKRHIDCGACGSDTCSSMARKIALGVAIPENCIARALEITKQERARAILAEQSSQAKSVFLSNINHEIRTPMNVIVGLTDLLLDDETLPDHIRETLKKIESTGATLLGIINDILDISKIESGKLRFNPTRYDTAQLISDVLNINTVYAENKPITFQLKLNENLYAELYGDDIRIKQILNNLLSNAFKYTRVGIVTLSVDCIRTSEIDVELAITVSDTGIGMRSEDLDKLFTAYNQIDADANRKIEGTGLGLSITKSLTELMGGRIMVESEYGKGSVFRLNVRQGYVNNTRIGANRAAELRAFRYEHREAPTEQVRPDLSYARVLVVDDFPLNLDVARGLLGKYKMQVDCVTGGREAVDLIEQGAPKYDVIFMDHMMSEMNGVEATRLIRGLRTEYAKNIPIIAVTANAVAGNEQMFLDNGFNGFLAKPISSDRVYNVLSEWVIKRNETNKPEQINSEHSTYATPAYTNNADAHSAVAATDSLTANVSSFNTIDTTSSSTVNQTETFKIPGVDITEGLALYDDDTTMYYAILQAFVTSMPAEMDRLRKVDPLNLRDYVINAHTVKGSASSIGAFVLAETANDMEILAKNGDATMVTARNPEFISQIETLIRDIQYFLDRIKSFD